jgi:hypothetical protein
MLHPSQFEVNEAWIAFQLNDAPIQTAQDGAFNCVSLMDAASCYILGMTLVPAKNQEPSKLEVRRILKKAWELKKQYPHTLFVPRGRFQSILPAEATREHICVVPVEESELALLIGEARQGFKEYAQGRHEK